MRTLVDLLDNDQGYVRIYADLVGFAYEKSTYTPPTIPDLFDRMSGYESIANAREAAALQLLNVRRIKRRRRR